LKDEVYSSDEKFPIGPLKDATRAQGGKSHSDEAWFASPIAAAGGGTPRIAVGLDDSKDFPWSRPLHFAEPLPRLYRCRASFGLVARSAQVQDDDVEPYADETTVG
jgi:hypothetical protein